MHQRSSSLLHAHRTALVVGHPGHELLVHGWLARAKPQVFVLTDGSGGEGQPRLASTTRVIESAGATAGALYGVMSDRELYSLVLDRQLDRLTALFTTLTDALIAERIECVVADSAEGYNPTHDLCRILVNAAVARAARRGWTIGNYEFLQVGRPDGSGRKSADTDATETPAREVVSLDEAELQRKLAAAGAYPEMAAEVARALERHGTAWCQTEYFLRAPRDPTRGHSVQAPYYETYGAERVGKGLYSRVLRYQDHVVPVVDHLRTLVDAALGS